MLAIALIGSSIFAGEIPVQATDWNKAVIWATDNDSYLLTPDADAKNAKISVKKAVAGNGINNIQCWLVIPGAELPNGKYRLEYKLKSNKAFNMASNVILTVEPWTSYSSNSYSLNADQEISISNTFDLTDSSPKKAFRVPCLALGLAPAGTELTVSDLKLFAIK